MVLGCGASGAGSAGILRSVLDHPAISGAERAATAGRLELQTLGTRNRVPLRDSQFVIRTSPPALASLFAQHPDNLLCRNEFCKHL